MSFPLFSRGNYQDAYPQCRVRLDSLDEQQERAREGSWGVDGVCG